MDQKTTQRQFMLCAYRLLLVPVALTWAAFITSGCNIITLDRPEQWATPVYNRHFRNTYRVSDQLYRSAQPGLAAYREFQKLGVKVSVNLRNHVFDAARLRDIGIEQIHVPMTAGSITVEQIATVLSIIENTQAPVLVHCQRGADRTGAVIAFYRIVIDGWSKTEAIDEMVNGGYGFDSQYDNIVNLVQNADIGAIKRRMVAHSANARLGTKQSP